MIKTMKKFILVFCILWSTNIYAKQTLKIYTYDSFVAEWGPGPIIKKIFESKFDYNIEFITVDSAATLLTKIILEGSSTKADIVLGLDMNLFEE